MQQGFDGDPERLKAGGTQYYCVSLPEDRVQLDASVVDLVEAARPHYLRVGLNPTTTIVSTQSAVDLLPGEVYVPCMYNPQWAPQNALDPSWNQVIVDAAMKSEFVKFMTTHGFIGLAPATQVARPGEVIDLPAGVDKVWFKRTIETSGGVNVEGPVGGEQFADKAATYAQRGEPYQIQEHVHGVDISNQYWVEVDIDGNATLEFFGTTEQVMVKDHHAGNRWPAPVGDWGPLTHAIAEKLVALGLRGFFGVDARVNGITGRITEFNLRVNGSSVPLMLARRLGADSVSLRRETLVHRSLTPERMFQRLEDSGHEFRGGEGVVVYLVGWFRQGTVGIATFGANSQRRYDKVERLLAMS